MHHRAKDISGERVGYLTALRYHGSDGRKSQWVMACDCGAEKIMDASEFKKLEQRGVVASCGCRRKETIGRRNTTHGMSKHPAYAVWRSMVDRCLLPSHQAWANYGARGITVCASWVESFDNFWADMGAAYKPGLTLDRADNDRGYGPDNCRWATYAQQASNTRANRKIGDKTAAQLARELGVKRSTMYYRLKVGVSPERLGDPPDASRRFMTSSTAGPATDS